MDPSVRAAARALSAFDPLGALRHVALREDASALALRGIAMAQLDDFPRARKLLRRAARSFGSEERSERARCIAAEAEIALVCRDLAAAGRLFESALVVLEAERDRDNALFVRLQLVRRSVLMGRLEEAREELLSLDLRSAPERLIALRELVRADIGVRALHAKEARRALRRAAGAARRAGIPSLIAEVTRANRELDAPVARLAGAKGERPVGLEDVESMVEAGQFIVDACRRQVRQGSVVVSLIARPVLFSLALALGEAAPRDATRAALMARAFSARRSNESLRARLRVEIGRLRRLLAPISDIRATKSGFALEPRRAGTITVLLPPAPGDASALLALLAGGEAWSTSALAAALGTSQRSVQRSLSALHAEGRVQAVGRGRSRRWVAPAPAGFATTLLLVARTPRR